MNALYGYPSVGPAALGNFGAVPDQSSKMALAWDVASGESARALNAAKREQDQLEQKVKDLKRAIDTAPAGRAKDEARLAYANADASARKGKENLATAIASHNEIADVIAKYSLGAYTPARVSLSGLGVAPLAWGAIGIGVVLATAVFLDRLALAWAAWNGDLKESKGFLQQGADALKEAGVTIKEFGSAMTKTAWAVAGLLGAYLAYQLIQDYRKGRRSSAPAVAVAPIKVEPAPKMLPLKTAPGRVVA